MLTREEATTRVARGAAHLDAMRPGWFTRIDVGTLTLHDPCGCIVGQLCGLNAFGMNAAGPPFCNAVQQLFGRVTDDGEAFGVVLGFSATVNDYAEGLHPYQPLQDAWIAAIADRVLAAQAQDVPVLAQKETER